MADTEKKHRWLVRMHHRMRSLSFGMLFAACSLHMRESDYGTTAWLMLGLLLLVYPHVQFWRSSRAADGLQTEMRNLLIDSILLGMLGAGLGFPLWITFSALLGTLSNNTANKGWRGVGETVLAFAGGAVLWISIAGWRFAPETTWPATLVCFFGLATYLTLMGIIGFSRNLQLRQTREKLQLRERELLTANETLVTNLQEIDELHQQLREQANRDPLTNLYNRRYLDSTLERELARSQRRGQALSLIMIDIDHFKRINDNHGHQAGDEMLIRLGAMLGGMARAGDIACRYGGEEFLLVLPGMPLETALTRAENLRAAFGEMQLPFQDVSLQTTLSVGIALYPVHGETADSLIQHADQALYKAKDDGRNRVVVWAPEHRRQ